MKDHHHFPEPEGGPSRGGLLYVWNWWHILYNMYSSLYQGYVKST